MDLVEVNGIHLEPAQTILTFLPDGGGGQIVTSLAFRIPPGSSRPVHEMDG
jgi:hypothetical protein